MPKLEPFPSALLDKCTGVGHGRGVFGGAGSSRWLSVCLIVNRRCRTQAEV